MAKNDKRNFAGGIWHGTFLALGNSLTRPTTVISAFIAELTGSTVWVGCRKAKKINSRDRVV
mgnify:CR=1 FL=1